MDELAKRNTLTQLGYDPSEWDIDDLYNVIPKTKVQPSVSTTPLNPQSPEFRKSTDTPLTTFGKSAAISAFPTIAGGGGAAGGAALGAPLGPAGILGGGLLGAILSSIAANKVQQAVLPEDILANVAASQEQNPISGVVGSLATLPLGGFNPSPRNLLTAGRGLVKTFTPGLSRLPEESAQLLNVGLGAGIGAAQPLGMSLAQGEMPNPKDVLLNTLIGAVFNKPNVIGRRLDFREPTVERQLPGLEEAGRVGTEPQAQVETGIPTQPAQIGPRYARDLDILNRLTTAPGIFRGAKGEGVGTAEYIPRKSAAESALAMETQLKEQRAPIPREEVTPFEQPASELYTRENAGELQAQETRLNTLQGQLSEMRQQANQDLMYKQYEQMQANNKRIAELEAQISQLTLKRPPFKAGMKPSAESAISMGQPKYQEEPALELPKTGFQKEIQAKVTEKGIDVTPTAKWTELFKKFGITHRNTEITESGDIINAKTGFKVAGQTTFDSALKRFLVKLNPEKATLDTAPHEMAHVFLEQMRQSPKQADREFVLKFEKLINDSPEFRDINSARMEKRLEPWTPEEFIATEQGLEFVNRNLKLRGESDFKTFYRDLWSHIKTRFGKNGTPEDFRRILQYKTQYDKGAKVTLGARGAVNAEEGALEPQQPGKPEFIGVQKGAKGIPDKKYFNLTEDIIDPNTGKVLHRKGSTLSEGDLDRLGVKYSEEGALEKAKGEGKTPYPFRLKELQKGSKIIQQVNEEGWKGFVEHADYPVTAVRDDIIEEVSTELRAKGQKFEKDSDFNELTQDANKYVMGDIKALDKYESIIGSEALDEIKEAAFRNTEKYQEVRREAEAKVARATELGKIESPTNKLNQDEPALKNRSSFVPILTSRFDKISEKLKSPTAKMVTDNLHRYSGEADIQSGRIGNALIASIKGYNENSIDRVYRYLHQMDDKGSSLISLSSREKELADNIIEILRKPRREQIEMGLKVKAGKDNYRQAGIKSEGYMFNILDPKVAYEWAERPNSVLSKGYDKAYIDHQVKHGVDEKEAKQLLHAYKGALGDNMAQSIEFGALRKAEGNGLPWDLVDKNFASASARYGRRAGNDLAYFKYIQNDPKMRKALSLKDQFGNPPRQDEFPDVESIAHNAEVKAALRTVFGTDYPINQTVTSMARSINNTLMGIGTAARNILQMPAQIASYVQIKQLPLVAKAIARLNESKKRAFENNAVRASFADYDTAGYYEGNPNPVIRLFNRYSDFMRKYQGRNLSDKFEGEYYYSLGELLAVDNIARAKAGDKEARRFIDRFSDVVEGGTEGLLKAEKVTQDDISRIAKRFVDAARGTYGAEGLPSWAIEGEFAPFTALSRWSIEKSNTVWKDVIQPLKQGIYGPLLRYVLGAAGVGYAVEQMNELLSNKRGGEPTINETLASGEEKDLVAKAISLMQLASFAGIVSDGAQLISSAARNKGIKYNQPLSFPLYTWLTDTMAGNISGTVSALKEGEDPFETLAQFVTSVATQSVQSARYLDNNFIHPEEAKRKEKFRDYNIWQELTDRKEAEPSGADISAAYKNLGAKKFKREEDLSKANEELVGLIKNALDKSKTAAGFINVEKLRRELVKIKQNSYQTMPSPDEMPASFMEYVSHLRKTQGEKAAAERVADYMGKRVKNKIKAEMVPSL